jgi:DNA-binding response OmpR family regulator
VYGIVHQSGGSIGVYSEPGEGTTFKLYLPRVDKPQAVPSAATMVSDSTRGQETILLVEDEDALRKLAARFLGELGYRVVTAATADEALEAFANAKSPIDLLLTDVVLPGRVQGNELASRLLAVRPELPVLFTSGYTRDATIHAGRLDEGVNFLPKPFHMNDLAAKVKEVLDRARR